MKWLLDRSRDNITKLWRSKAAGGFQPQWLRENVYLAPTLKRETKGFHDGAEALPKVLEAYMDEAAWPTKPTRGQTARPPQALAQCGGIVA